MFKVGDIVASTRYFGPPELSFDHGIIKQKNFWGVPGKTRYNVRTIHGLILAQTEELDFITVEIIDV